MHDELTRCDVCKKVVDVKLADAKGPFQTCPTCLDNRKAQEAYEERRPHIRDLEGRSRYDEALACLNELLEQNRALDHDGWLARKVLQNRAFILYIACRYAEAVEAYRLGAQLGFEDIFDRWTQASEMADALKELGRDREALEVLTEALGHKDPKSSPDPAMVAELVRFSNKLGVPVDPKWQRIAEAAAKRSGNTGP